jgi:flagellar hook-associated protein 2
MASTAPLFSVGGLASGLDTQSIIDGMVKIEQQPLDTLRQQQTGFKSQVSLIAQLVSKISDLRSAADGLANSGALGLKATSSNVDFTATPSSQATAGTYDVSVQSLASAAKDRSAAFDSGAAPVKGGTLQLTVQGVAYDPITITDGESLADVAGAIRGLGAPISAQVVSDGTHSYLSITNLATGYTGSDPSSALQVTETSTGSTGQALGLATIHSATNANFTVDGLAYTRQSNIVTDAIQGTTLALKGQSNITEGLTVDYDSDATAANLQKFADAYNAVINFAQTQLAAGTPDSGVDRNSTLAGNSSLRSLVADMQGMVTSVVGNGNVRTLADLGFKTNFQDGTLSIDTTKLASTLAANPLAINDVFAHAQLGVAPLTDALTRRYTDVVDGVLTSTTKSLNNRIKDMDTQADQMQARLDAFRDNLVTQFTAMEQVVSGLKATGNFLTQQSTAAAKSG